MASQQQMRRNDNKTYSQEASQGDQVPEVTHFESLTVMESANQPPALVHRVVENVHGATTHDQTKTQKHETQGTQFYSAQSQNQKTAQPKHNYGANQKGYSQQQQQNVGITDTVVDVGKKGRDIAMETGETTVEYASKAAGVAKDAALVAGLGAAEAAYTTAGYVGKAAGVAKDAALVAGTGAAEAANTTAGYVGKAAGVAKDAALVAGSGAAEVANKTTAGVRESMEGLNAGVGGVIEETAAVTEKVGEKVVGAVVGASGTVAGLGKQGVVAGKDVALKTGKTAAGYVGKAAGMATGIASDTASGLTVSMESLNAGVGGLVEGTALEAEKVAQKTFETVVDVGSTVMGVGKKGASYLGGKAVSGKDVSLETGKATAEYAGKAAGVAKDAALVGGWTVAELASETAAGVNESLEGLNAGVGEIIEGTALVTEKVGQKTIETVVGAGKKGASYVSESVVKGKDVSMEARKATGEYVGKAAGAVKDAALVGGWTAAELASDTASGVTESMEYLNTGVAGLVEGTARVTENVAQKTFNTAVDVGKKGASYVGEKAVAGKDVTLETGKTAVGYVGKAANVTGKTAAGFVGKAADVVKDATLAAGWGAAELASGTAAGVTESMETLNAGVGGLVEGTACATENVAKNTYDTMTDVGKKGVVAGKKGAIAGTNIALETGKATAGYVGQAVDVAKGAALAAGRGASELASDTTVDSKESLSAGTVGAGTKPKGVVVEREEVTINYGQRRNTETGSKKEQRGYTQ